MASAASPSGSLIWQTRLSREAADIYEQDLAALGLDRSEALRRGLRLLHREALEIRMAGDVRDFYRGARAPLSDVTAAAYDPERSGRGDHGADMIHRATALSGEGAPGADPAGVEPQE